jgi:hypothetical protein
MLWIFEKVADRAIELSMIGAVSAISWGVWSTTELRAVIAAQAISDSRTQTNGQKITELVIEQRVTNERLESIRAILRDMRDDTREYRSLHRK